jgi:subtilisin family serine protease
MKTKWVIFLAAAAAAVALSGDGLGAPPPGPITEVVVTLEPAALLGRSLQSASGRTLLAQQAAVVRTVQMSLPEADVRWRYHLVLDGFAVTLPRSRIGMLASLPGVAKVWPSVEYHALDNVSQIGAPALWGPTLATAGQGMKIGIIDDGLDAAHAFFNPAGYAYPPGFPKGQTQLATPKVIVQRAFPAPHQTWKYADAPYDPVNSYHATHVAGIAAGDHGANANGRILSGVAPAAYLGNYKALTVPTPGFGLDGNSAEITAAIEAAVADGMNVINLSLGEPEVEPSRDIVDVALDNAARAGVVPVVAAGNEFGDFGKGSVGSPANAQDAITVGAVDSHDSISSFSSAGPTPVSLRMKPDVAAPGEGILSSTAARRGTWETLSGTSMSAPHVAGAAALLLQRHPAWTVAQVKSALVLTGDPARVNGVEAPTTREGGGVVDLPRADDPLVFADPTGISFGELAPGATATQSIALTDAGGGAGEWSASVQLQNGGVGVTVPAAVTVPGSLPVTATAGPTTGDVTGFVVLTRGSDTRRIPFWFDVSAPKLGTEKTIALGKPGRYRGTLVGAPSRVSEYRYPAVGTRFPGPERVYRVSVTGHPVNFGVVVLSGRVTPHITFAGSEDRLAGVTALPIDVNPYREAYGADVPASGVLLPARGAYDVVFDSGSATPGRFSFRYWIDDTTPPTVRLTSAKGGIAYRVVDAGSGVQRASIVVTVDGTPASWSYAGDVLRVRAAKGRHRVVVTLADWQETKNMEDLPPILPNTRTVRTTVRVR